MGSGCRERRRELGTAGGGRRVPREPLTGGCNTAFMRDMKKKCLLFAAALLLLATAPGAANAGTVVDLTITPDYLDDGSGGVTGFTVTAPAGMKVASYWQCQGGADDGRGNVFAAEVDWPFSDYGDPPTAEFHMTFDGSVVYDTDLWVECDDVREVTYQLKWRRIYRSRAGTSTSARARSGNCSFNWWDVPGWLAGDCFGPPWGYIGAAWSFRLPSDARDIRKNSRTWLTCCSPGNYDRGWVRTTTHLRYHIVVNGYRGFESNGPKISYLHRKWVRVIVHHGGWGSLWVGEPPT
jgi:hypothetical protein